MKSSSITGAIVVMNSQVESSPSGNMDPPPQPRDNLVGSILTTLCCCLPFGIVSIVYAARVNTKYSVGDYHGAAESAAKSRTWMWWGIAIGLIFNILYLIVVLGGQV